MKRKIAIVEDDYLLALVLTKHLSKEGYDCFSFPKARDFFEFFENNNDLYLLILDVKLKGEQNGIELFENFSSISSVPVIFSTGNSDIQELNTLKTPQVKGIFIKPIHLEELTKIVHQLDHP